MTHDKHNSEKLDDRDPREDETSDPKNVGKSTTRRAEDIAKQEQEPGRYDTGTKGKSGRPAGKSTARHMTGVDPQERKDKDTPPKH